MGEGGVLRKGTPHEVATQGSVNTRMGAERAIRYAFELAMKRDGRKHVTLVHKTNVLTFAGDLWQRAFNDVAAEYPEVGTAYNHVDAACIYFVQDPHRYDVIVTDNLFGDILTDLGGAVSGGIGLASSANLNPARTGPSMFEPVHGSAPDIVGTGKANPTARSCRAALMLDFLGEAAAADRIRAACAEPGTGSTSEIGSASPPPWQADRARTHRTPSTAHTPQALPQKGQTMPITTTPKIWMNGELVDWDKAQIHVLTHTLHYGTGVFEGIRAYETADGPAVFRLTDHIERDVPQLGEDPRAWRSRTRWRSSSRPPRPPCAAPACPAATSARSPTTATARWASTRCRAGSTWPSPAGRGARTSATTPSRRACG